MRKFTPTGRNNPCVVCDDESGKCRQHRDGEIHLCMVYADSRLGDIQNGFKCVKLDKGKGWSTWKIDNSQEWSQQQCEEWQRLNQQRRLSQAKEDDERRRRSLTAAERHEQYTRLLAELTLHPDDRADLVRRGFTHEQIELSGFKSVESYQKLQSKFSELLPGTGATGKDLIIKHSGYICPIRDTDGLIVACQVRLRALPTGESNRYRWLSSKGQTLHLYPEGCRVEGELPLAVFRPEGKPEGISLAEGVSSKPFLVAQRFNQIVIGAAGGQWPSSEITFKRTLNQLSTELNGTKEIILHPDAGDVLNQNVMNRWHRVAALLKKWGWAVSFSWWGQTSKQDADIDELADYSTIRYITPSEFWEIAKLTKETADQQVKQRQQRLQFEAEDAVYRSLTEISEKPWKEVDQKLLDLEGLGLEPGAIYIVLSAKATGKTEGVKPIVKNYDNVLAWFTRVSLGRAECKELGISYKDDLHVSKGKKRGFCSDSAFQFPPHILGADGLLLGDEADQIFDHNFGDTCNKGGKRPLILATLQAHIDAAIAGGGIALFMSADIAQKEVNYIKQLAPEGCPVRLIVNHYKPPKEDLLFDLSELPDAQIERLLKDLENGKPCFVIDDIKNGVRGCKSIAEYIRTIYPELAAEIVEINSDTSGAPEIIEFLKNINEASKNVRLICCSPSVVSGISIKNGRFVDGVYGFFNGVLTVKEACQAITRVRGANVVNVWAAEQGLVYAANRALTPKEVKQWYLRNYEANCKHILGFGVQYNPVIGEWESPHFELFCKNAAYRNLCMERLRERLKAKLEQEGYSISLVGGGGSDMVKNGLKQSWSKKQLIHAYAVANANILTDEQLEALQNAPKQPAPEEKLDLEKTYLLKSFGQELIDATVYEHDESGQVLTGLAAMVLKNERDVYRNQLEAFYLLRANLGEVIAKDLAEERKQEAHGEGRFPGDLRWRTRQKKAREFLGLHQFLNPEKISTPKDYELLGQKAKAHPALVKDTLNLGVEKITNGQIFGELMQQVGLDLKKEWASTQSGQKRYKTRQIEPQSWNYAQMYVAYRESLKASQKPEVVEASNYVITKYVTVEPDNSLITPPYISIESQGGGDQNSVSEVVDLSRVPADCDSFELSQGGREEISAQNLPTVTLKSHEGGESNPVEQLVEAFKFCELPHQLASVIEGYPDEVVEKALALQPDQSRCRQLSEWLRALSHPESAAGEVEPPLKVRLWHWSELPLAKSVVRWIDKVEQVRLLAIDADGSCQVRSLLSGLITHTHASQLMPISVV